MAEKSAASRRRRSVKAGAGNREGERKVYSRDTRRANPSGKNGGGRTVSKDANRRRKT